MARDFSGSSHRLDNTTGIVSGEPFSMGCWFNADVTGTNDVVMSVADKDVANKQHRLLVSTTENVICSTFDGALSNAMTSTSFSPSSWNHALGVWASGSDRRVYLNGGGKGTNTDTRSVTGIDRVTIGTTADSTPAGFWDGKIAEAAVWDIALTDGEALALASGVSPLKIRPQNLVAYWPLYGRVAVEPDYVGGYGLTVTGATAANHPRIFMPSAKVLQFPPVAAGGTGRTMGSLAGLGGLAGMGGLAGRGGGLAN